MLEFKEYISKFRQRRIALIVDNTSCQKKTTEEIELKNIEIFYLPPNTTSLTQPIDASVIVLMKRIYTRKQVRRALPVIDEND